MEQIDQRTKVISAAISILEKDGFHTFNLGKVAISSGLDIKEVEKLFPDTNVLIQTALQQML